MGPIIYHVKEYITRKPDAVPENKYRYYLFLLTTSILAFFAHFTFIFLFWLFNIQVLFIFNIVSAIIYSLLFFLYVRRGKSILYLIVLLIESILHHTLCVILIGWDAGFQYYLLTLAFGIMLGSDNRKLRNVLSVIWASAFLVLDFYFRNATPQYDVDALYINILYYINLITVLGVMVFMPRFSSNLVETFEDAFEREHKKSEELLHNILPAPIAKRLKEEKKNLADGFECTSILFADIVGFTPMSQKTSPEDVVSFLNSVFSRFDDLAEKHGLEKIKTIGDAYMVAAGIPERCGGHAELMAEMALDMVDAVKDMRDTTGNPLTMRIGINSGPVIAGVIGKKKFIYDLWGDAVNTASRMESHGLPGEIQVTGETYELLKDKYEFCCRGEVAIKGKGAVTTWLLKGRAG